MQEYSSLQAMKDMLENLSVRYSLLYNHAQSHPCTITVMIQAYRRGLRYPSHFIIFMGWYQGRWWLRQDGSETCTAEERETIMQYFITVHHYNFLVPDDRNTTTGLVG